ncbi:EH signature domain-containing protein [Phormidium tenue]|jgi:hypothetical protein|uniref:Zorya protein ZorC EH domain-containing protein n=1 Tax=Phormidium tenue FACHB-1050 TaxID=2692857 RepID=A0ABR8CJS0_9CYAN|nr:EH signature domain-containing protein [Phormidium tenue]MBD2320056.1 hypothetical protein [Phormidium tenue FACHB-1050]
MNLRLQSIPQSSPTELAKLAEGIPPSSQNIPDIDQILEKINNGKSSTLSAVDCFWCVLKKTAWDNERSPQEAINSSKQLWVAATQNKLLKYYLLRGYLRFYLENQPFSSSLKETFYSFENTLTENDVIIKAIALIPMMGIYSVVSNSVKAQWGKHEILKFIQEHTGLVTIDLSEFTLEVAEYFSSQNARIQTNDDNDRISRWLIKCLNQETDLIGRQIKAIEKILTGVRKEDGGQYPELVDWLKQNYQKGDQAKYLSENAKRKLREWIGAVNFADFAKLIRLVADSLPDFENNRKNKQKNQLLKRSYFWGNYSDNFSQVRIFIPTSSERIISSNFLNEYTILYGYHSEPTEICVFDFDTHIIVEFFRGKSSEIRLFSCLEDVTIRDRLFSSNSLSISDIRHLGGKIHDHAYFWQYYCERWLSKHNIYPNSTLTMFRIDNNHYVPYTKDVGMPSPTFDQTQKRRESSERFNPPYS